MLRKLYYIFLFFLCLPIFMFWGLKCCFNGIADCIKELLDLGIDND